MIRRIFRAILLLAALAPGLALAQVPGDTAIGAIRWDAWFEGAQDSIDRCCFAASAVV